jgi:hypothetical protein
MMNRIHHQTIISLIGVFSLCMAASASAQPRWGRERQPQAGACFYEDRNFGGRYFCVRPGDRLGSLPNKMGDEISSVRVLGYSEVTVFRDSNLHGRSARFIGDVRDLKAEGWNDQISSVDVENGRDYSSYHGRDRARNGEARGWRSDRAPVWSRDQAVPREGACFYEDTDFRGQYFCAPRGATYTSLPRGFNDRISSIRVLGGEVRIFQNEHFRGRSNQVRSDVANLRGNWKDNVSSIRVF